MKRSTLSLALAKLLFISFFFVSAQDVTFANKQQAENLKKQIAKHNITLASLRKRFQEEHAKIRKTNQQIEALVRKISTLERQKLKLNQSNKYGSFAEHTEGPYGDALE